jgi:hypothetical protein
MLQSFGNLFGRRPPQKGVPALPEPRSESLPSRNQSGERAMTFSKVFRWHLPGGDTHEPASVEVVGSFTHWQKVALIRDSRVGGWHVTLHHLQGNRTHHYMLLVDGKPTFDKTCDGLAVPHGPEEERFQLKTDKGPRVMMLFAQTK